MKIIDLQEYFETDTIDVDVGDQDFDRQRYILRSYNELGRGEFSRAESGDDPHVVTKQQLNKSDPYGELVDLFDEYAEMISEKRLWEFIHFPRVYKTKRKHNSQGQTRYEWEMERLIPVKTIEHDEIVRLSNRYFKSSALEDLEEEEFHISEFVFQLEMMAELNDVKSIKDETLAKSISILNVIFNSLQRKHAPHTVTMDLHSENIMFRRTQNGLQVVFSDPFVCNTSDSPL